VGVSPDALSVCGCVNALCKINRHCTLFPRTLARTVPIYSATGQFEYDMLSPQPAVISARQHCSEKVLCTQQIPLPGPIDPLY